ncbi:MAG: anthranilate synthase component I [Gammaproteobacteria bacterium]|nr:anthranilate synthase component I [Gammaproteobacteria bacterium]
MLSLTKEEFSKYARQGYTHIPLIKDILADLDTPLSAYLKLANEPYTYLLESVHGGEKWGRYSIIGLKCQQHIRVKENIISHYELTSEGENCISEIESQDPLAWIEDYQQQYHIPSIWNNDNDMPRFLGGLVGYFGYETIKYIEPRLAKNQSEKKDELQTPDIFLLISNELIVFDNLSGRLYLVVHAKIPSSPDQQAIDNAWNNSFTHLESLAKKLISDSACVQSSDASANTIVQEDDFISGFTQAGYEAGVNKIKQYITDGDAMQVVLSQRMTIPFKAPPINLYRALRSINPSPYMYFFNLDSFHIVGASPEILTRVEDKTITVRPIAGTRPRGKTAKEDKDLELDLLADPKELAEHLMLIDLGRNDIGRVCKTGTVTLTDKMIVERYSHVMHIVSNVEGQLNDNTSVMDALRATFPAGTVSGAPKIRAMEIIDELEPVKRGIYSGAIGYFSWTGNLDTAIAIRTAVIKDEKLHIQAGAGIVADSVPRNEWDETMNKGRSIFRAVSLAQCNLDTDCNNPSQKKKK